jgi:predicted nucleotidyltransferase
MVNLMLGQPIDDPTLERFRVAIDQIYGDRLERVVLFGSRARGDAREDSDYDIAVFIKGLGPLSRDLDRLADVETDILYDTGAVVNALPFAAEAYEERTGFMHELRRDGLDL